MTGFLANQYLCPLKLDLCCIESADLLWNICSCKRIKDGTTETSHVDQLKDRSLACARPRDCFGRDGHPQAASSSPYRDSGLAPKPRLGEFHRFDEPRRFSR